jgi:hypothetical protein
VVAVFGSLWCLSAVLVGLEQVRYAQRNYPHSIVWRLRLFSSAFCSGFLLITTLMYESSNLQHLLMVSTLTGVISGLLFAFGFPYNMQGWYPKRHE